MAVLGDRYRYKVVAQVPMIFLVATWERVLR